MKLSTLVRVITLVGVTSCSTVNQGVSPDLLYRKDMPIEVDGEKLTGGVYVLPKQSTYQITARPYRKADVFKLISCHRHKVYFGEKKVRFRYEPKPLESADGRLCALKLGAFDSKLQNSWAYIDFQGPEKLQAIISCNGERDYRAVGVSVCQSMAGLIQMIRFTTPVDVYYPEDCPKAIVTKAGYEIELSRGRCIYLFQSKSGKRHRLTTFGYDDVIMR